MAQGRYPHIRINSVPESRKYTSASTVVIEKAVTNRDRKTHGEFLQSKFTSAWEESEQEFAVTHSTRDGVYLEFISDPNAELVTKSLEEMRTKKVRLLNVRHSEVTIIEGGLERKADVTLATVYVSNDKKQYFVEKFTEYLEKENKISGNPKNQPLVNSIGDIRKALLIDSFWCDDLDLIPDDKQEWIEVWLSSDDFNEVTEFEKLLEYHKS